MPPEPSTSLSRQSACKVWIAWGTKYGFNENDESVILGVFSTREAAEAECERRENDFDDDSISEHEVCP